MKQNEIQLKNLPRFEQKIIENIIKPNYLPPQENTSPPLENTGQ